MRRLILLLLMAVVVVDAIKFERCQFLDVLRDFGVASVRDAAVWTCLAERLTNLNTSRVTQNKEEKYYGLFQVNSRYWCSIDGGGCNLACDLLVDDNVEDDIKCALQIFEETQQIKEDGFLAWPAYEGCKENSVLVDCNVETERTNSIEELPSKEKVYEKCELARELMNHHNVPLEKLGK